MLPKKHLSGAQKRKKKKQEDEFIQSQKGAIHRFFPSSNNVGSVNDPEGPDDPRTEPEEQEQQSDHNLNAENDVNEDTRQHENLQPSSDTEDPNINEQEQEASFVTMYDPRMGIVLITGQEIS
jgi:hypothetical protein